MPERGWRRAVRSADLHAGDIFPATAGRQLVLVARLNSGEPVAFSTHCPHQDTKLEDATVWDDKIRCPRHQYLYDARTGENIQPTARSAPENLWKLKPGYLPVYGVDEHDGWIWISPQPLPPPPSYDPALEVPPAGAERPAEPVAEPEQAAVPEMVKTVQVRAGATFELRLPTNPLPGHAWTVAVVGGLVEVVEEGLLPSDPPRWQVRITARGVGEDEVRCGFRAPWDVEPSELRRYVVRVLPSSDG
jgi:nitrite reductase/ring-hydroxylating ferredoxin subunit/predicted secreted protein